MVKKTVFALAMLLLLFGSMFPVTAAVLCEEPGGLVPCGRATTSGGRVSCPCELGHVFVLISRVYRFLIIDIAVPMAVVLVVAGGVTWIVSAGDPGRLALGKRLFWGAAMGLGLVLGSWLIVDTVFRALGFSGPGGNPWWSPF